MSLQTQRQEHLDLSASYAPGKIILSGEHAVVYGHPAIALALDFGVRITAKRIPGLRGPVLRSRELGLQLVQPGDEGQGPVMLKRALERLADLFGEPVTEIEFELDSSVPPGRGLGSSAALSVALIRAVCSHLHLSMSLEQQCILANELETIFHGAPSGIDHNAITYGGLIRFQREHHGSRIESLPSKKALCFAIGIAGPHEGTRKTVEALSVRAKLFKRQYEHIFTGIADITEAMQRSIAIGDLESMGALLDLNQGYLNALGVSTPELESLCHIARRAGALGAKLTGAGTGGAVIALVQSDPAPVMQAFLQAGYLALSTRAASENS